MPAWGGGACRLADGRRLAYAEFGDPNGQPVFYFHGFPGSRVEASLAHLSASQVGVRLIAVDRPGMGRSCYAGGRSILGWPSDVEQLACALGLHGFKVLGVSGGSPYALACGLCLGHRVRCVAIVSGLAPGKTKGVYGGMSPFTRLGLAAAAASPLAALALCTVMGEWLRRCPDQALFLLSRVAASVDAAILSDVAVRQVLAASVREAFRAGPLGAAVDLRLLASPWQMALARLQLPVLLWHGDQDRIVLPSMGRALEQALPHCKPHYYPGEGHYSLVLRHQHEILRVLADA